MKWIEHPCLYIKTSVLGMMHQLKGQKRKKKIHRKEWTLNDRQVWTFREKKPIRCNGQSCLESSSTVKVTAKKHIQSHQYSSVLRLPWRQVSVQNKNCTNVLIWLLQLSYPQLIIKLVMWFLVLWGVNLFGLCTSWRVKNREKVLECKWSSVV